MDSVELNYWVAEHFAEVMDSPAATADDMTSMFYHMLRVCEEGFVYAD